MASVFAKTLLTPTGWKSNVRVSFDDRGIQSLELDGVASAADERHEIIIPGMPNLHSHAFQRGMAGLAETRGAGEDSFWSWRDIMYRFALSMTPDHAQAFAAQLYVEMLEAGFTRVGEFHYLHHDLDGSPYGDIAEMAARIAGAAAETGIDLTLLPVFYAHSTFGGAAPNEGQRRFVNSLASFEKLYARCERIIGDMPGANLGVAPHSLRAVTQAELAAVTRLAGNGPKHIHIAEQVKEVDDCLAWSDKRPVEWLLDHVAVDAGWCLIHATHMTADETRRMAQSGAVAGLCPVTEANLGDGIFPGAAFTAAGGAYGVGSDSNVLIGIGDELRQLEYSQRLLHRSRNVMAGQAGSTGRALFDGALRGGTTALGAESGLEVGRPASFVSLSADVADVYAGDAALDAWIFANAVKPDDVWVRGRKLVSGGRHVHRDEIEMRFSSALRQVISASQ
ncbi:formimidoylglutamate deiminase [Phyllobacterium sp. 21LDTY02-6]|uniref:formimidoylglutamate deiminase n=1 Tax=Phyllobacterium sp. 21LDTY02-6 TaxID=2944903 RepID=UPI0020220125|nr:formimidoylglutamate deiminase [Phyllobacterium sp. 21LDTY02-6]MCO4319433.1 formimidoylglutamate deiminase [Phyllobacterium sp. 21LDTY02-6]